MVRGEFDLAQRVADDLLRLSRERNDADGLALGHHCSGQNLLLVGRFASSRSHLEEVLRYIIRSPTALLLIRLEPMPT
jgi:hypothetical protein